MKSEHDHNLIPFHTSRPSVTLTTDGGCWPNPGPGAWAYVLRYGEAYKEGSGKCTHQVKCTNNRAEMQAIIEGLNSLKKPCAVTLRTDSMYCIYMVKRKGIRPPPHKNTDLFLALRQAMKRHVVSVYFIKGHAGDLDNERCDKLASDARHLQDAIS